MLKQRFWRNLRITGFILFLAGIFYLNYWLVDTLYNLFDGAKELKIMAEVKDRSVYKAAPFPDLGYSYIVPEKQLKNLHVIGRVNRQGVYAPTQKEQLMGITMRTLRYRNIAQKVEKKYGLEKNIILGMVAQETGGAVSIPNATDDGGIGLCHMQPYTASMFGLKTYQNCRKMRSRSHGKKLRKLIRKHNSELKKLISYDDRFHPVKNLDAVGRMLAYYKSGEQLEDTPQETAIRRYAGRHNYDHYYRRVKFFQKKFNSKAHINQVRKRFNAINPDFYIGDDKAGFDAYIAYFNELNRNYELDRYH